MSETANGTAPAPPAADEAPCADCATTGEKILAGLAIGFGLLIIAMGIDMATGGKLSGMVPVRAEQE
jgi:hypothetical protein